MYRFILILVGTCVSLLALTAPAALALDVAVTGTASASSSSTRYPARYMNDASSATFWLGSSSAAQTVIIDLGSAQPVTASDVTWKTYTSLVGFSLYGSTDGAVWTQLSDQSTNTAKITHTVVSGSYRYLRMNVLSGTTGICDWSILASAAPAPTPTPTPTVSVTPTPTPTPTESVTPTPEPTVIAEDGAHTDGSVVTGAASASSSSTRYPARYMNDASGATYWLGSSSAAQTVTIDLGSARTLSASDVTWRTYTGSAGFRLHGSSDGAAWTQLSDQSANTAKSTHTVVSGSYRYLRMSVLSGSTGIYNWRIYAALAAAPTPTPTVSATPTPTPTVSVTPTPTGSVSVMTYGAKGDGTTNDLTAISAAVTAAGSGGTVYLPAGTYYLASTYAPTAKVTFVGAGLGVSVLAGHIDFGSGQQFRDLSIRAAANSAVKNQSGASGTTFQRVSFRGGGVAQTGKASVIALGGSAGAVDNLHFIACQFDRPFGTENASRSNGFNIVSMIEVLDESAHLQTIHFEGCTFGTSNGTATGSPRMGIELTSRLWSGGTVQHYAQDVLVSGCTFEFMDETAIDIESGVDTGSALGNFTITGNLIKGVGTASSLWANGICLEAGQYALIRDNTVYGCKYGSISIDDPGSDCYATVTGNTIDDTKGYPSSVAVVTITENRVTFSGNTIATSRTSWLTNSGSNNTITSNTINGVLK